jgi:hypothetical protein
MAPKLKGMATWTGLIGHAQLRCFVDEEGRFWLEQNSSKQSKRGKLAREGYDIAWEFGSRGGSYTGRMLVDGELYTPSEATKKVSPNGQEMTHKSKAGSIGRSLFHAPEYAGEKNRPILPLRSERGYPQRRAIVLRNDRPRYSCTGCSVCLRPNLT